MSAVSGHVFRYEGKRRPVWPGKVRSVPTATRVAEALARLDQREYFTNEDDLVFCGTVGGYLDGSALSKRYRAALRRAALRPLRFHDLRHTFWHPGHRRR